VSLTTDPKGVLTGALLAALGAAASTGCSGDPRPAEWNYISPVIMEPNCATASCHSRATAAAGLDFSDADRGYKSLTGLWVWVPNPTAADKQNLHCGTADNGVPVCDEYFRPLVTPYVPGESRLVNVLRARGAPRMPPDRPLNEADIRLIEQWILDGARREQPASPDAASGRPPDDGGPDAGEAGDASGAGDAAEVGDAGDAGSPDGGAGDAGLDGAGDVALDGSGGGN
jgi:hypothetical protein